MAKLDEGMERVNRFELQREKGDFLQPKINILFFSATDTTKKIVTGIAEGVCRRSGTQGPEQSVDFTLPAARRHPVSYTSEDLVIIGVPVYAGRVPNVLLKYLNTITGNGALAVPVVVFGNRAFDDALIELNDILESAGFRVVAAGAFVGEHSFSKTLGKNRPDDQDMLIVDSFADRIWSKVNIQQTFEKIQVPGNRPYLKYYMPKNELGEPVKDFRMITPKTKELCIDCKLCAEVCPMGSIDEVDVSVITGICIKCCACIKKCPVQAKYFDDPKYLRHKKELELAFDARSEPEFFI